VVFYCILALKVTFRAFFVFIHTLLRIGGRKMRKISNQIKISALLLCWSCLLYSSAWATVYYVDSQNGNDASAGLSESTPLQTINKVNSLALHPGDSVLFKRGAIWKEQLIIKSGGITISDYGTGELPLIQGCDDVKSWAQYGNTFIYSAAYIQVVRTIVIQDGVRLTLVAWKGTILQPLS
jgi:hypothetical protein